MKISLVSEHASPLALLGSVDAGGQNVHVAALATSLAAAGAEVVVHTRRDDPALARRVEFAPNVVVDHVDAGPAKPLAKDDMVEWMDQFADELVGQWDRDRPDVAHAHFWMSGMAAVAAGDETGVPVALTYHALGAEKRKLQGVDDTSPLGREMIESWLARSVDRLIATTTAERATVIAMGADPCDVDVVPCGVDLDLFRPARSPTTPLRRSSPATGTVKRYRILCVSRLVPRKGIADVVAAMGELPDAELMIVGGPPQAMLDVDPEAVALRTVAAEAGVEDRVTFLGAADRQVIPELMRTADVVCCCPWYEPFGMVAVEAMACGVPVVATAVGGLAETVVHGRTGLLVPPRQPDAIAEAIRRVLGDDRARRFMVTEARRRAEAYAWSGIGRRTMDIYQQMAASPRRRGIGPRPAWQNCSSQSLAWSTR